MDLQNHWMMLGLLLLKITMRIYRASIRLNKDKDVVVWCPKSTKLQPKSKNNIYPNNRSHEYDSNQVTCISRKFG